MRVLVQKCENASVSVKDEKIGSAALGLVLFVGFTHTDTKEEIDWMVNKIINLRIFEDQNDVMNLSVKDIGGSILSISQFTLYASCEKGNRPSYSKALPREEATKLYDIFNQELQKHISCEVGSFGDFMEVKFTNLGPTTIWLEREKNV